MTNNKKNKIELRAAGFCNRSDGVEGEFSGYVVTWGTVDSYLTSFKKGCFAKTLKERAGKIKLLWNHDAEGMPIGAVLELIEDDKGLFFRAKLALGTELGLQAYELMKIDAINTMSFGFRTIKDNGFKNGVREITEVALFEISPVNFESNPTATINDVRSTIFAQTIADSELNNRGYRLKNALEDTMCDIWWSSESSDQKLNLMDQAIADFHSEYIGWMKSAFDAGIRGMPGENELASAVCAQIEGSTLESFAANTPLTITQVRSLCAGKLVEADISCLSADAQTAYRKEQEAAATALQNKIKHLPDELREFVLKPFVIKVDLETKIEANDDHNAEQVRAIDDLISEIRKIRAS